MIRDERAEQLEEAMEVLSDAHREIILLRKFQELSFRESPPAWASPRTPAACCSRARSAH